MRNRLVDDRGSVLLLIIGAVALALALVVGVMSASSLYLERKRLFTVADGAALVAAQSFDLSLAPDHAHPHPRLSTASVKKAARSYIAHLSSRARHSVVLTKAFSPDSRTAIVEVRSVWHPPIVSMFMPAGLRISSRSSARTFY